MLVVDDDATVAEVVGAYLVRACLEVERAADGLTAVELAAVRPPDVAILDLMLPGIDGLEVCRRLREITGTPIIMLTAKGDTNDVVEGLESGADDYIVKPFNPEELVARIRTRLRPTPDSSVERLQIGDVTIDVTGHEVRRGDQAINLTFKFGGIEYPIHPLDVSSSDFDMVDSTGNPVCVGTFQPITSAFSLLGEYDIILGMAFSKLSNLFHDLLVVNSDLRSA